MIKRRLVILITFSLLILGVVYGKPNNNYSLGSVYYLEIIHDFGDVSTAYSSYIKKNLDIVDKDPTAVAVIIEVNTPGGLVSEAEKIIQYIQNTKAKTITFVNPSAFSAGAFISLSSDITIMSKGSKIGDAFPIMIGEGGKPSSIKDKGVRAKILSGLKSSIRSLANKRKKRLILEMSEGKYKHLKEGNSIRNIEKIMEAMVDPDVELTQEEDGYNLKKGELLTLTGDEAYNLGIADGIYNNRGEVLRAFNLDKYDVIELKPETSDILMSILVHPVTTSILLTLGMLGMIMEFWTSGWGVAGTIGILALSLFFYGQIVGRDASLASLVLFIVGLGLLAVELFVIPGFGIVGVAGAVGILLSFVSAMGVDFFNLSATIDRLADASIVIIISIVAVIIISVLFFKSIRKTKGLSGIILTDKIEATSHAKEHGNLVNREGVALTILRPSGRGQFDDISCDVITNGECIEKGDKIKAIKNEKGNVVVKKII